MEPLKQTTLRLIGTGKGIQEEDLPKSIYKMLGVQAK